MADRRLRVFYTVARLLSFTRAAEALHMTQPAVTFQVRQLENYFDTRLFDRTHHRVVLTDPGRKVYEYAERIFELYADMENALKELNRNVSGALTLGASSMVAEHLLPAVLRDFKRSHPEINLRLKVASVDELVSMIPKGKIDVGVVEEPMMDKNLLIDICQVDQMVVITPPGHPLVDRERVSAHALARYPFICREAGSRIRETLMNYLAGGGVYLDELNLALELSSVESIKGAVEAGMGIAVVSRFAVVSELEQGLLACIGLDPPLQRSFYFVRQSHASRAAEELLDFVRGYCR